MVDPPVPGATTRRSGVVSVVVVNRRAADETVECLRGVSALGWPAERLELVCVDDASGDGGAERIRAAVPQVRLVGSPSRIGTAGGRNLGARHATGEYLALLAGDARPDPGWLSAAVGLLDYDRGVACVASKVLDQDGRVEYAGGGVAFTGMAGRPAAGPEVGDAPRDVLHPAASALVARAAAFADAGGFDERYVSVLADVDLGWRLTLLGHRVRYLPASVVRRGRPAAGAEARSSRERYLLERNALLTIVKNFDDATLRAVLAPSLLLAGHATLPPGDVDAAPDQAPGPAGDGDEPALAGPYALGWLAEHLEEVLASRREVQGRRVRSDLAIARLLGDPVEPTGGDARSREVFRKVAAGFGVAAAFRTRRRILVVTADILGDRMAGPAIRAFHIAEQLAAEHEVCLVSTSACTVSSPDFRCRQVAASGLREPVQWAEVVVFQGWVMQHSPWIADTDKILVVDVYDPMHLEQLEQTRDVDAPTRERKVRTTTEVLNRQLLRGDFFLCASEKQRHFWLGQLAGLQRLTPGVYDADSSLRSLLAVCPFGLSAEPPRRTRPAIKGVVPGIGARDKVVLWAGGVYNWFDPLTLIRAVDRLRQDRDDVRLFFLGMQHPNPGVPQMRVAWQARRLADELGLTDKHVFFNESWVDYTDRQNYLLDADVGVSTHFEHVETTFSFRTRMLDYLWAALPIVAVGGDSFGSLIDSEGLGITVPERDVEALAAALGRALYDRDFAAGCRERIAVVRERFVWSRALEPLVEFCNDPHPAADRPLRTAPVAAGPRVRGSDNVAARNLRYARERLREGGVLHTGRHGVAKAARLIRRRPAR